MQFRGIAKDEWLDLLREIGAEVLQYVPNQAFFVYADGEGRFGFGVFRPSNSTWFIQRSTAGTQIHTFGTTGDISVPNAFVP